jgi:hypothetical protein
MNAYCIIGLLIAVAVVYFFAYALCRVSSMCSRAEEQRELLRRMEEASRPRITGDI